MEFIVSPENLPKGELMGSFESWTGANKEKLRDMGQKWQLTRRTGRIIEPLTPEEIKESFAEDTAFFRFLLLRQGIRRIALFLFLTAFGACAQDLQTGLALGSIGWLLYWGWSTFENRWKCKNVDRWYEACEKEQVERERMS